MKKVDSKNFEWNLTAYDNGKQVVSYPVPNTAVGDMIKVLVEAESEETCSPTAEMAEQLKHILGKKIDIDIIAKLSRLDRKYLEQLINGVIEPAKTKNIISLSGIIGNMQ